RVRRVRLDLVPRLLVFVGCRERRGWVVCFFFFSSRRRHTRFSRDWSSDVCSSDLGPTACPSGSTGSHPRNQRYRRALGPEPGRRSEERRVGKECGSRRAPYEEKK